MDLNQTRVSIFNTDPQFACSSHDLPLSDALIPTISTRIPEGWYGMVHLLGKVWHITYLYEAHELLCLRVRHAFRLLRICAQDTQMYMKWVGGCRNAVGAGLRKIR